jgi:DNA-binding transcriptional LysR family regulator
MASSPTEMSVFERVADRGSFAGAAEDMGLSASAVAKLISRLELRLGVRLINRTTRRLALTAEGQTYLERVREILGAIDAAECEITSARVLPRGHLRVHTFPIIAVHHLAPTLPDFLDRYPQITFDFMVTNRIVDLIGEKRGHLAAHRALEGFRACRAQDCRSHPRRLRKPKLHCPSWPPDPAVRSLKAFMSDREPKSGLDNLALPNQWQAD